MVSAAKAEVTTSLVVTKSWSVNHGTWDHHWVRSSLLPKRLGTSPILGILLKFPVISFLLYRLCIRFLPL